MFLNLKNDYNSVETKLVQVLMVKGQMYEITNDWLLFPISESFSLTTGVEKKNRYYFLFDACNLCKEIFIYQIYCGKEHWLWMAYK